MARLTLKTVVELAEEGSGGDSGMLRRQRGEHLLEHDEANPMVVMEQTERQR